MEDTIKKPTKINAGAVANPGIAVNIGAKKMETKNVKLSKDLSLIDKKKINTNETKVVNPKLCDFFEDGLKNYIKNFIFNITIFFNYH